jgi:hypothetical protein
MPHLNDFLENLWRKANLSKLLEHFDRHFHLKNSVHVTALFIGRYVEGSVTDPAAWETLRTKGITHIVHGAAITPTNQEEHDNPGRVMEVFW